MRKELNRENMHKAIDTTLSDLKGDPWLFQRISARAAEGEVKVKKRVSAGLVLAIVLTLLVAIAVAATLLSHRQVVEQVAVPLAVDNDKNVGVNDTYTADDLAKLVRTLDENGITLEENTRIMQALKSGQGYYEEETIMEICRQAFGGNFYSWTLEEQNWFEQLMVQIGFYESYEPHLPGPDNMSYEEAEAFAFASWRRKFGESLPCEDRSLYQLERQFYYDTEQGDKATWYFMLLPKKVELGRYSIQFLDEDPQTTASSYADLPDWSGVYTGERLLSAFQEVYSWAQGTWPQAAWQQMHEMMQEAQLNPGDYGYTECLGYKLTSYPEPTQQEVPRSDAIRIAKEALGEERAVMDSAILTEYGGHRAWMVCLIVYDTEAQTLNQNAGTYAVTVDSGKGTVESIRKKTKDDGVGFAYIPQPAYEKATEGILKNSDYVRLAAEAIGAVYPQLDLMNDQEFEIVNIGIRSHEVRFVTKNIRHGNASATVTRDGTVSEITADTEPLNGDNIFNRYWSAYGYFGQWEQQTWVQLGRDMETLQPKNPEYLPLKASRYPEESTVTVGHERAKELAIKATGKRNAEVNTCVLVDAGPHPVWIMRLLTDDPDNPVIGIDAENGETVFTELYKVDYTPYYVTYSMPEVWRSLELQVLGAPAMAKTAITHRYGDMWLDEPELDLDNGNNWELQQDGLTVRYLGRWVGMKSYEVELDSRGFVLRCEETESTSTEFPPRSDNTEPEYGEVIPTPTPLPDGKPWFFGMDFADEAFWDQFEKEMAAYGVTAENIREKEQEWATLYGPIEEWPYSCFVISHFMSVTDPDAFRYNYPIFPREGKKTREEITVLAKAAFHQVADGEMGAEWVDQMHCYGQLRYARQNSETGEWVDTADWWINMCVYDEQYEFWNPKGYVQLDEDGNVLEARLELLGNG